MKSLELKYEMNMILSDSIVSQVLSLEAESVGVSLEEYVERFLDIFYSEPQKFDAILSNQN